MSNGWIRSITCLIAILFLGVGFIQARFTLDTLPDELLSKLPGTSQTRFLPGETGSITVNSPYSLDGASTIMWGFYKNTSNVWVSATFGTGTIMGGTGTISYALPVNYASDLMWEVDVDYSPTSNDSSCLTYENGVWDQFENYDPNGTTINMKAYTFDQKSLLSTGVSYRVSALSGTVFPDPDLSGSVVDVLKPWAGNIADYTNAVYQSYPKTGLYPTYAMNKGYSIEVLASNPSSPDFQKVRLYKDDIGYSVELFGYRNANATDPLGYIWWTTLIPATASVTMDYDGDTGVFSNSFATPLELNTMYFIDPWVYEYLDSSLERYYYISTGGGTDLLLSGAEVEAPVNNITSGMGYNTIQAAIDAASPGDLIHVSEGTYIEQLHITTNNLTIQGASKTNVIVKSPDVLPLYFGTSPNYNKPVIFVDGVASCTIKDLTVDGNGKGNTNYRFQGIGYWNAGGMVDNVDVLRIQDTPFSGAQHGVGVYAYNNVTGGTFNLACRNMLIDDYQKNAMALMGAGLTVDLDNIIATGVGGTTVTAQNGIQIAYGAGGTIDNCDISGNIYTGSGASSAGILGYQGSAVYITDTDVYNNYVNVDLNDNSGYLDGGYVGNTDPDSWDGIYMRNPAVRAGAEDNGRVIPQPQPYYEDYVPNPGRTNFVLDMQDVEINGCNKADSWGVYVRAYGNTQVADLERCQISDWAYGIYSRESGGIVDFEAHNCSIAGNTDYGFYANTTTEQDATHNWWGDAAGPVVNRTGDNISEHIAYDPWWGDAAMTELDSDEYVVNQTQNTYFTTIQAAINAAGTGRFGDLIEVPAGTYIEDVHIDRTLTLSGEDAATTIISGPIGGLTHTVFIDANNVTVENFTITREGNNVTDWNNAGTNQQGVTISQVKTGCLLQDCIVTRNRNGVYLNNTLNHTIQNNVITNNRTGVQFVNEVTGCSLLNNEIKDNWTLGVLLYHSGVLTPTTGFVAEDNNISGNWYSQVECKIVGTNPTVSYDFSPNWFGSPSPYKVTTTAGEPGYAALIPVEFGGTASSPGTNNGKISGQESAKILVDPWWINEDMDILNTDIGIYVVAPEELIADNEMQLYQVKISDIASLRGYTVQVKVPKADFYQPVNFNIGSAFQNSTNYPMGYFFFPMDMSDTDYWIYDVTGSYQGGYTGIEGTDVVLFTFEATSLLNRDNIAIPGCWITVPLDQVILKDDQNPYHNIPCSLSTSEFILIDATEPTITIDNLVTYPDGMTLPIDPALTVANGYPSVAIPLLSLDYWDNYNLDLSRYMLVASGGTVPTTVAEFAAATYLFGAAYVGATNNNLIWNDPDADLNVALNNLPNGTYTLYFLAIDDAGNFVIEDWTFVIDKEATGPIVWDNTIPCRTTPNSNNSIDLKWANPVGAVNNHIWVLSYGDLGSGAGAYPEYNAAGFSVPAIPTAPNPYNPAVQNGWTKYPVIPAPLTFPYALTGMARGWYYITIFAEDASGNISEKPVNPFYRESISYWPGDVETPNGTVLGTDIAILSAAWGTHDGQTGFNNIVDVGPSTDYARRSRPTPDNVINIEDLMMFAMNYNNTVYTWYPRGDELPVFEPVSIALSCRAESDMLYVDILLDGNDSAIKGLDIPVQYGTGLSLQYVSLGEIWPEGSLLLHTDMDHIVGVTASALGYDSVIQSNGCVATLAFKINGNATDIELRHMTARTMDNREIVIEGNPNDITTGIDDPGIVVPPANFLGCNHPNPFNGSTAIEYGIKQASHVKLSVFNTRGQLIRTLVQDNKAPGSYQAIWNGKDNNNLSVSSGIYFFRMETNEGIKIIKGLLAK